MKEIPEPSQKDMLEFYKSPSVHCTKCNYDIGKIKGKKCPNCRYDTLDSISIWIKENAKFDIK